VFCRKYLISLGAALALVCAADGVYAQQAKTSLVGTLTLGVGNDSVYAPGESVKTALWLPFGFDLKIISRYGAGLAAGDVLYFSMNMFNSNEDMNHPYFGLGYWYFWKKWMVGAALLCFPVYIADVPADELIAGKLEGSYFFLDEIGVTLQFIFGGTSGWSPTRDWHVSSALGISMKI
jgi:hypothetical protein